MLIPSRFQALGVASASLSRRVNANSQLRFVLVGYLAKLIKKGEC